MRATGPARRSIASSSAASGSALGVPMATRAALPTTNPTASASTTSKAGSPDDTSRSRTSTPTPPHRARRQAWGSQGEAITTIATTEAMSGEVANRGSVSSMSRPVSARTRSTTPRSASAESMSSMAQVATYDPSSSASARR
jgi:hypothetical protein